MGVDARGRDCAFVAFAQVRLYEKFDKTVGTTFIHSCAFLQLLTGASLTFHCGVLRVQKRHPNRCQNRALDCVSRASHWFFKGKNQGYMCVVQFVLCGPRATRSATDAFLLDIPISLVPLPTLLRHSQKKRILHRKNAAQTS